MISSEDNIEGSKKLLISSSEYFDILSEVKDRIKSAQYKAVLGANKEMIMLYWSIGNIIIANSGWGNKFINLLIIWRKISNWSFQMLQDILLEI